MNSSDERDINLMAIQVKEILPQVPLKIIKADLNVTFNIDETITRLLDGVLLYQPETVLITPASSSSSQSSASTTTASSCSPSSLPFSKLSVDSPTISTNGDTASFNTAAKVFGRSPNERMQSFKERKKALIEAARQRYIQKHGLKLS